MLTVGVAGAGLEIGCTIREMDALLLGSAVLMAVNTVVCCDKMPVGAV
jgi:hypothetical protein